MAAEKRLIDANVAIERAKESDKIVGSSVWETGEVVEFLEDCPIVDAVEVVHGRWEPHMEEMEDGFGKTAQIQTGLICSECGDYSCCGGNYCKSCGAKMDGDGDG